MFSASQHKMFLGLWAYVKKDRSVQTSFSVHPSLMAFGPLALSPLHVKHITAMLWEHLCYEDIFLCRVDVIVCSHADVVALNDVAVYKPSVSICCWLVLPWIID